jgi:SAM-dependent methyltransferase
MNCNDYIIKDNKEFPRDFDKMYQNINDPWNQTKRGHNDISLNLILNNLKIFYTQKNLSDIGCGPGHISKYISEFLKIDNYYGYDISRFAINKALESLSNLNFNCHDITKKALPIKTDLILSLKTLYYCAPEIDITLQNIFESLKDGGLFAYTYNQKEDSFTNRFLNIDLLREKILKKENLHSIFTSDFYDRNERTAIDIFLKS